MTLLIGSSSGKSAGRSLETGQKVEGSATSAATPAQEGRKWIVLLLIC
jgi:hypothetical protein